MVIEWVQTVFPKTRSEMKGLPWGDFYNQNKDRNDLDPEKLEQKISRLLQDEDVTKKVAFTNIFLLAKKNVFLSGRLNKEPSRPHMNGKRGNVQFAESTLTNKKCTPIILFRGVKAEKPSRKTARCFAGIATSKKAHNEIF